LSSFQVRLVKIAHKYSSSLVDERTGRRFGLPFFTQYHSRDGGFVNGTSGPRNITLVTIDFSALIDVPLRRPFSVRQPASWRVPIDFTFESCSCAQVTPESGPLPPLTFLQSFNYCFLLFFFFRSVSSPRHTGRNPRFRPLYLQRGLSAAFFFRIREGSPPLMIRACTVLFYGTSFLVKISSHSPAEMFFPTPFFQSETGPFLSRLAYFMAYFASI